jgi:O-antigen/teichoic acid export membrane protein
MDSGKQLLSNTFFMSLNYLTTAVLSFLFWLMLGKTLIPWEYGIVTTSSNFIYLLAGIAGLGLASAVAKLISEDRKSARIYLRLSFKLLLLSNTLLTIFLLAFANPILSILKFDFNILLLSCFGIIFLSYTNLLNMILLGFQNTRKLFLTNLVGQIAKVAIAFVLVILNFSFFGALLGIVASSVIITFLQIDVNMLENSTPLDSSSRKKLINYSSSAFVFSMCLLLFSNIQYILLTAFKNPDVTGKFSVAMLMTVPIPVITNIISASLFPIASKLSKIKDHGKMAYLLSLCFRYSLMFMAPILLWIIPFSQYAVLIFSSEKYLEAASLFPILALGAAFLGFSNLFSNTLYASGRPKLNRNIVLVSSIIFLFFSLTLTYFYSSFGLSIAYLASMSIYFILSLISVRKHIHFRFQYSSTGKIIASAILSFLFLYFLKPFVHEIIYAILLLFPAALIYIFSLYILKFYTREDLLIIKHFSEKFPAPVRGLLVKLYKIIERRV